MGLLTIGAFARASRLSPKALRLYDELGLLPPAQVDPATGYRFYDPAQLERARLVAWLRRIGMPLARIREVCGLQAAAAADEVRAYWAEVEADTAARRELATFLIDHLSWKDAAETPHSTPPAASPLAIRYATLSDPGRVRDTNQDAAYAGTRLLAVADGYGRRGAPASTAAIEALKGLETDTLPAGELLNVLQDAVRRAGQAVQDLDPAAESGTGADSGTTLTAMLWTGSQLALVHIGDSRAYLLRDGELFQITHDHTLVQSMVDQGRLTPDEATSHPQRSLLLRALTAEAADTASPEPDLHLHDARPGDRYLLCSDGLSTVVPADDLCRVLSATPDREQAVRDLVALANQVGGPDNVTCVVADVVEPGL
ncbi:MerR family transcriptional regulator [Streptomyces sp. NPDC059373]